MEVAIARLLLLLPGLITPLGCLIWIRLHGNRSRWCLWGLISLSALWVMGGLWLAQGKQLLFIGIVSLAFSMMVWVGVAVFWRWNNQLPEINRLKRLVESHSDRISALSHEIRTPLALIKGAADLLLEGKPGPLTEQQTTFLQTISQNGEHLISLAEDILIQARIDAGIFHLHLEPVDIIPLVRRNVNNMRSLESSRAQKFQVDCPQVIERIYADPRLLTQVMYNLIRNACRHTSQGGNIYIKVSENDGDDLLIISVTDDGAGMTSEERNRLFERFYSSHPLGDGTGLGLLISRQIIELHCGHLMVDTSLGKGTTVLFTIPRWRDQDHVG